VHPPGFARVIPPHPTPPVREAASYKFATSQLSNRLKMCTLVLKFKKCREIITGIQKLKGVQIEKKLKKKMELSPGCADSITV
jgi:hypothetical protein